MAKSKYDPDTFPILAEGWAREGLKETQIAHNLGISKSTFESYKKKYPDFLYSLKRGKGPVDFEVENALLKKSLGFKVEVRKMFKVKHITYDPQTGKKIEEKEVLEPAYDEVYVPPEAISIFFWLKNRLPKKWRDRINNNGENESDNLADMLKEYSKLIREGDLSD